MFCDRVSSNPDREMIHRQPNLSTKKKKKREREQANKFYLKK